MKIHVKQIELINYESLAASQPAKRDYFNNNNKKYKIICETQRANSLYNTCFRLTR